MEQTLKTVMLCQVLLGFDQDTATAFDLVTGERVDDDRKQRHPDPCCNCTVECGRYSADMGTTSYVLVEVY